MVQPTAKQRMTFMRDGFLLVPDFITDQPLLTSLQTHALGIPDDQKRRHEPDDGWQETYPRCYMNTVKYQTLFTPVYNVLYETAKALSNDALVNDNNIQIAYNPHGSTVGQKGYNGHKGYHQHRDGGGKNDTPLTRPTIIAGLLLHDVGTEQDGATMLWPGSHIFAYGVARHWAESNNKPDARILKYQHEIIGNLFPSTRPESFTGKAGTAIFWHYLTNHGIAPNESAQDRITLFQRFYTEPRDTEPNDNMNWFTDPWRDYTNLFNPLE